jgi:predicted ABC-type ATPase
MLAGPNGAGKSTFYESYLSALGLPFLNADVLVAHTGMDTYEAAERIDDARRIFVTRRMGFVTETVFSDPVGAKVDFMAEAGALGFDVQLIYIGIEDAEFSAERVAARVRAVATMCRWRKFSPAMRERWRTSSGRSADSHG